MYNCQKPSATSDFEFLSKLGQGSFGIVYKVRRKRDKNIYVLKQINIKSMNIKLQKEALNEVSILSSLNNPYIVKYYESFVEKDYLNIVMEYCEGGDLAQYIKAQAKPLNEEKIWKFFLQMCTGLAYIHSQKVLHRDIKSMNIFLSKSEDVRIGDLGVAKALAETNKFAYTMIGTPYYLSPEMCEERPYNAKSDIWALGCVLYEMCTKRHPFEATNQAALVLKIINGKYAPIPSSYSSVLTEVLNLCLCRDYKKRPFANALLKREDVRSKARSLNIPLDDKEEKADGGEVRVEGKSFAAQERAPQVVITKVGQSPASSNIANKNQQDESSKDRSPHLRVNPPSKKFNVERQSKSPMANERVVVPLQKNVSRNNQPKHSPTPDARSKSPIAVKNIVFPSKNQPEPAINKSEIERAKLLEMRENRLQNKDDRNVKRIRKGAPQAFSRQAMNAGNPRPVQKSKVEEKVQIEPPQVESDSSFDREISEEGRSRNKIEEDSKSDVPQKRSQIEERKEEPAGKPDTRREESEITDVTKPTVCEIDTDVESDVGSDAKGKTIEKEKVQKPEVISQPKEQREEKEKLNGHGDIPVFHIAKDTPEFAIEMVSPEVHGHEDNDEEDEDGYWNSDEEEEAYNNDKFEDDEEHKSNKDKSDSQDYDEDFEEEFEEKEDKGDGKDKEIIMQKMTKARKELAMIEGLLKERSAICAKEIGQDVFQEIIVFLRKKIGFVEDESDLKEIDEFLRRKIGTEISHDQMNYITAKILPFEIKKCRLEDDIRGYNFDLH